MNKWKSNKGKMLAKMTLGKLKDNPEETIMETATRKLRGNSGETIVEALVSLIIAVISIALLVTSITAASKINAKSQARTTDQLSFAYVDTNNSETGTVDNTKKVAINFGTGDSRNDSVTVNLYTTSNDYIYYKTH